MKKDYDTRLLTLAERLDILPDKSEENAELTLHALWAKAQGVLVSAARAGSCELAELSEQKLRYLDELIALRLSGTPLAHLTERQSFMGLELLASPDALIPRVETEIVVRLALRCLEQCQSGSVCVVDICTGSGNIALAVASHHASASVFGADLSESAVALARANAERLQLAERVSFRSGDLLEPFREEEFMGAVDVLICNPPYIIATNVKKMPKEISLHEPDLAFNGGPMGIAIIDRAIREAVDFLKPGGWLCMEMGAGQGAFVERRLVKSGAYCKVQTDSDSNGIVRAIRCQKLPENV